MSKKEYYKICEEFYKNESYKNLANEIHHGNNRIEHIYRVSKLSFYMTKFIKCDSVSTIRGSLMHDFFLNKDFNTLHHLTEHPSIAINNSKNNFKVNELEERIIKTHMFPITREVPKTKEEIIVGLSDKIVAIYEFFKYQLDLSISICIIFVIEMIKQL